MNKDTKIFSQDICLVKIQATNSLVTPEDYRDVYNPQKTGYYLITNDDMKTPDGSLPKGYKNIPLMHEEIAELAIFSQDRSKFVLVREIGQNKIYHLSDFNKNGVEANSSKPKIMISDRLSLKTCQYILAKDTVYTIEELQDYNSRIITTQLLEVMSFGPRTKVVANAVAEKQAIARQKYQELFQER